jgi:hypothetical protein
MENEWSKIDKLTQPLRTARNTPSIEGKVSAKALEINKR